MFTSLYTDYVIKHSYVFYMEALFMIRCQSTSNTSTAKAVAETERRSIKDTKSQVLCSTNLNRFDQGLIASFTQYIPGRRVRKAPRHPLDTEHCFQFSNRDFPRIDRYNRNPNSINGFAIQESLN